MEIDSSEQEKDVELIADISECAEEAQVRASAKLAEDLQRMVNAPALSDVAFLCKDGKRVQACRILLASRSDVLRSMFMNGMAESSLSEVALPEISSQVLLSVFEFLYTGTMSDYLPRTWGMACELIIASRFFLLSELEMTTRKFMQTQSFGVAEDLSKVASFLTEAVGFKALCDKADVSLRQLVTILSSNWADSGFVHNLTEDAFHYLLANSMGKHEDVDRLSLREYLRYRQVIRWWVYFGSSIAEELNKTEALNKIEELVNFIAPDVKGALSTYRNPNKWPIVQRTKEEVERLSNDWKSVQLEEKSSNAAIRLLSRIDYNCIHPLILVRVVEPLEISPREILNAFRFHALRRPMSIEMLQLEWEHGASYGVLEEGSVVCRTGTRPGIAVMAAAISPPCCVYQWSVVVEEIAENVLQLGLIYYVGGIEAEKPKLDFESLSQEQCARVLGFQGGDAMVNWEGEGGCDDWKLLKKYKRDTIVLFSFNTYEHTCSLCVDGEYFKDVWKNLPSAIYYPAVCFGYTLKGRLRFELVRGFECL